MIDKKKLGIIIAVTAGVTTLLVVLAVWVGSTPNRPGSPVDALVQPPAASPSATPEDRLRAIAPDLDQTARKVALQVVQWGSFPLESRRGHYVEVGMSPGYAAVFQPIWQTVFEPVGGGQVSGIYLESTRVLDTTGEEGYRTFQVAIEARYTAQWHADGRPTGSTRRNVWVLTVDEHSGLVTAVDQPSMEELDLVPEVRVPSANL